MKHFSLLLPACLLIAGCSLMQRSPSQSQQLNPAVEDVPYAARGPNMGLRHRILILPFLDAQKNDSPRIAEEAQRAVVHELSRTGQFVIVSPDIFPQDPKKYITQNGDYNLEKVSRIAANMGVAAVLEGKIVSVRARRVGDPVGLIREIRAQVDASIQLKVAAGTNGREVMDQTRNASVQSDTMALGNSAYDADLLQSNPLLVRRAVEKAVYGAIPEMVRSVEKLSWEGRIALVSGERVFINAGRLSGIQIGDILKVTEAGQEVYDPETGRYLGRAPGRMKGTIEVVSYFGKDGAIAVIHSGSGFKTNDRVELY